MDKKIEFEARAFSGLCEAFIERLQTKDALIRELTAWLVSLEWSYGYYGACPACHRYKPDSYFATNVGDSGHSADCRLVALIAKVKGSG